MGTVTHSEKTEPAIGGLRFMFCGVLVLLLVACATTPPPKTEPQKLLDHTADSDYRLEAVSEKLRQAEDFEFEGQRGLAASVIDAAKLILPADHTREREYLDVVKAAIWARKGEKSDEKKALSLLGSVEESANLRADGRLLADVSLVRVVLRLAAGDKVGAARNGDDALRQLTGVEAHAQAVKSARQLAFQFADADDKSTARSFARRAYETAQRLDDDEILIPTCLDVARVEMSAKGNGERYYLEAYEASYRLNSMGWRNVVIALAVDDFYRLDDMQACRRWGDRLRDYDEGALPSEAESGMYSNDYILLMAQYTFALRRLDKESSRAQEATRLALAAITALPESEQEGWMELAEKLASGLLKPEGEK